MPRWPSCASTVLFASSLNGVSQPIAFHKGHGTENDFVLLPDYDGVLELTPARVRALCDRRAGIGGDGVLRVVRAAALAESESTVDGVNDVEWFMDYRNADGSLAEMCGNGARVFARYLVDSGLVERGEFAIGTRAGIRRVMVHANDSVTVDMGQAKAFGESTAFVGTQRFPGIAVDVGNPHLVCVTETPIADIDLTKAPRFDGEFFPHGVNVEFVNVVSPTEMEMRVFERGSGETRSCGTGTVAVVAATAHRAGDTVGAARLRVPGGQVEVTVDAHTSTLTGPAVLLASGEVDGSWWTSRG